MRDEERLPESVSDQNREEAEPGHGAGERRRREAPDSEKRKPSGGESGEGSQSTGDPKSAG